MTQMEGKMLLSRFIHIARGKENTHVQGSHVSWKMSGCPGKNNFVLEICLLPVLRLCSQESVSALVKESMQHRFKMADSLCSTFGQYDVFSLLLLFKIINVPLTAASTTK